MKNKFKVVAIGILTTVVFCNTLKAQENNYCSEGIPIQVPEGFIWGINGHATSTDTPYYRKNIPLQVELLKEHQFDFYRLGIRTTLDGVPKRKEKLDKILHLLKDTDIKILPIIKGKEYLTYDGPSKDFYSIGYKQAKGFLNVYKDHFDHYVLFNEVNHKIKNKRVFKNGIRASEYEYKKFTRFADYLKGMITAIRELDPSAKIVINSTGYMTVGFLHLLKESNIDYDIIGYHWYSGMQEFWKPRKELNNISVYQYLSDNFSQEIWITEINRRQGSGLRDGLSKEKEEIQQREMIMDYINELDQNHIIKAFFLYELLDQPNLDNGEGYDNPKEAYYGIMDWDETKSKYTYKKISQALKFKIEETKFGGEDFIFALYSDITNSSPKPKSNDFIKLKNSVKNTRNKYDIVQNFLTKQSNQKSTDQQYSSLLNKISKNSDPSYWRKKLKNEELTKSEIINNILLSFEYWELSIIDGYERRTGFQFYH